MVIQGGGRLMETVAQEGFTVFLFSTLFSVVALSYSALAGHDNRYGSQHSRNSLSHHQTRYPSAPHHPRTPHAPRAPQAPRAPLHTPSHSYGAPGNSGYGVRQQSRGVHLSAPRQSIHRSAPSSHHSAPSSYQSNVGLHQSAPSLYGGGRHFAPSGPSLNGGLNHYSGPSHFSGSPLPYGGQAHASADSSHYSTSQRSAYNHPQESSSYSTSSRSNFPQQNYGHTQHNAQTQSTAHGREMKYTIKDPQSRGMTHVTETHVVSNRQMHGAEAEAAMQKLMGSMGSSSNTGFDDFLKGMGLPFY